jgi:hypothetical protein
MPDFNKPAASEATSYSWLHWVNGALLLGLWAFTILGYERLPDLVPGHIGPSGVTRWDAKQNSMWFILPLMGTVHSAIMYGLATAATSGATGFNVPAKKRLLTLPRDGQRYAMQPVRGFMFGMATWLLGLMSAVQYHSYRVAMAGPHADGGAGGIAATTALFLVILGVMVVVMSRAVTRRIDAWEARSTESA